MSDNDDEPALSVVRKTARSGNVDYTQPVTLHQTTKSRWQMIPWYVRRSDGTQTSIRLECYKRPSAHHDWSMAESRTVTLPEQAVRRFVRSASTLFNIAHEDAGEFVVIRVKEGVAQIGSHSPNTVAKAIMGALGQPEIIEHLHGLEISEEIVRALRQSIRLGAMQLAVTQLRAALETGDAPEQVYQQWCEEHFWAFGNAYVVRESVRRLSASDQADAILRHTASGLRDIVELKRPDMQVLQYDSDHKNYYFSAHVSRAIGQCHRYLDVFSDEARGGLRDFEEVVAYHPRAIVVIGRSSTWTQEMQHALHGLNSRLHGITVMTFDHLLQQADRLLEIVKPSDGADEPNHQIAVWDHDLDDEIPF